jgi:hypothetical protein
VTFAYDTRDEGRENLSVDIGDYSTDHIEIWQQKIPVLGVVVAARG